jgi:protein-tyrosine phosphatase
MYPGPGTNPTRPATENSRKCEKTCLACAPAYHRPSVIDLHCHMLPGIDDGPATLEESVEFARSMSEQGVRTVVATPHVRPDHPGVVPSELAERCDALRARLGAAGIELELLPGGELDLPTGLEMGAEDLRLVSLGQRGQTLLVETPYTPLMTLFEETLDRLRLAGFEVLLAHPERNPTFQRDPERLAALVGRGILVQVTASSLTRRPRESSSARLAHQLVADGLAHVIASDAHGVGHITRDSLADGVAAARSRVGVLADWMATEAPAAILAGETPSPPPGESTRRGWRRLLR